MLDSVLTTDTAATLNVGGFLICIASALVLGFILTVVYRAYARPTKSFAVTLATSFGCDLLKAKAATSLQRFFNPRRLQFLNRAIGIGLVVFGAFFIVRGFVKFL